MVDAHQVEHRGVQVVDVHDVVDRVVTELVGRAIRSARLDAAGPTAAFAISFCTAYTAGNRATSFRGQLSFGVRWDMNRVLIEWLAIASCASGFACFAYWPVLLFSEYGNFYLTIQPRMHVIAADGSLTFCDHPSNLEGLDILGGPNTFEPKPVSYRDLSLPGIRMRRAVFVDNTIWSLRISILLVGLFFTVAAVLSIRQLRSLRHAARTESQLARQRGDHRGGVA